MGRIASAWQVHETFSRSGAHVGAGLSPSVWKTQSKAIAEAFCSIYVPFHGQQHTSPTQRHSGLRRPARFDPGALGYGNERAVTGERVSALEGIGEAARDAPARGAETTNTKAGRIAERGAEPGSGVDRDDGEPAAPHREKPAERDLSL